MRKKMPGAASMVAASDLQFEGVRDRRRARGLRFPISGLLRLLVLGFASGRLVLRAIEDLSRDIPAGFRRRLGLRGGVSDTTLWELLVRLDPVGLRHVLTAQIRSALDAKRVVNDLIPNGALSIDGKGAGSGPGAPPSGLCRPTGCDAKGTPWWHLYALRAALISSSATPVLDQEFIGPDRWEPSCFPVLLERVVRSFPKLFRYVLVDAGMTSAANANTVLGFGKVYVFALKANLRRLFDLAAEALGDAPVVAQTQGREQGRSVIRELRRVRVTAASTRFPGAQQFLSVRRITLSAAGEQQVEERLFVTALDWDELAPAEILALIRTHWHIENGPNWTADVVLGEDATSPCKVSGGIVAVSWLRLLAYNILTIRRARLPHKDGRPQSWSRVVELLFTELLFYGATPQANAYP